MFRRLFLIARTIFIEAIRRREIYVIVLITIALLGGVLTTRFFDLAGLHKFYHEIALKVMSAATALTVIVLGARQLPREFDRRTIYTVLAKPVARWEFVAGKYLGVVSAGAFCLGIFMAVFVAASWVMHAPPDWTVFAQYLYLQLLLVAVLAALSFLLSMLMAFDAAVTTTTLIFVLGHVLTNALTMLYPYAGGGGRLLMRALNWIVPQPALFDLSSKVVHEWPALPAAILGMATLYAAMFVIPYLGLSYALMRRRPL